MIGSMMVLSHDDDMIFNHNCKDNRCNEGKIGVGSCHLSCAGTQID